MLPDNVFHLAHKDDQLGFTGALEADRDPVSKFMNRKGIGGRREAGG